MSFDLSAKFRGSGFACCRYCVMVQGIMARKPRIHYPGAIYHVMLRGNDKQPIFYKDEEYRFFENILAEGLKGYRHINADGGKTDGT